MNKAQAVAYLRVGAMRAAVQRIEAEYACMYNQMYMHMVTPSAENKSTAFGGLMQNPSLACPAGCTRVKIDCSLQAEDTN